MSAFNDIQDQWSTATFSGTYADVKERAADHAQYKQTTKRQWVTEKQDVATLFGNVQTKLKTYRMREYMPPPGLRLIVSVTTCLYTESALIEPQDLDDSWSELLHAEARRSRAINAKIREIQEAARQKFANLANDFQRRLHEISVELSGIEGPLEE